MDSFSLRLLVAASVFFGVIFFFVFRIDPLVVGFFGVAVLFALAFLFLSFFGGFVFYVLRRKATFQKAKAIALREGVFLGLALSLVLLLNSLGLLKVWDFAFIVIAFICLEIYLLSKKGRAL